MACLAPKFSWFGSMESLGMRLFAYCMISKARGALKDGFVGSGLGTRLIASVLV